MNTSGEVADLMAKEAIQVTEESVKLMALGAKNLAAIIMALVKEDNKLQGKTKMKQLLKADKPLCILQIKEDDLKKFNSEAKKYGVLFTAVTDKTNDSGLCDIIAKQDDVTKLNYIMEKLGYAAPTVAADTPEQKEPMQEDEQTKNSTPRAKENPSKSKSKQRGDTERTRSDSKPSVKKQIDDIKKNRKTPERGDMELPIPRPTAKKKKSKGVSR